MDRIVVNRQTRGIKETKTIAIKLKIGHTGRKVNEEKK